MPKNKVEKPKVASPSLEVPKTSNQVAPKKENPFPPAPHDDTVARIKEMEAESKGDSQFVEEILTKKPDYIILEKCKDGNWKGYMKKNGKMLTERQYDPIIVVNLLITHD